MSGRTVGVIGGMGPAATVHFLARLQALTPATRDQDHLRLLVDCNPNVPDRNAALRGQGPSPGPTLAAMARGLEAAGAELLVMPCNAAHEFAGAITSAVGVPFVDLIDTACAEALALGQTSAGVLAADGAIAAGLYQDALARRDIASILLPPPQQRQFMELLYDIKAGRTGDDARARMRNLAETLQSRGAEVLIAGCTEVPLVLSANDIAAPLVDSVDALARRTIAVALADVGPMPE